MCVAVLQTDCTTSAVDTALHTDHMECSVRKSRGAPPLLQYGMTLPRPLSTAWWPLLSAAECSTAYHTILHCKKHFKHRTATLTSFQLASLHFLNSFPTFFIARTHSHVETWDVNVFESFNLKCESVLKTAFIFISFFH